MMRITGYVRFAAVALLVGFAACSGDDDGGVAPANGVVLGQAIVDVGPVAQDVTLGVGPRSLSVSFPAGALPQRRSITVRSSDPVMRGQVLPVGSTVQIATRAVQFVMPARMRQALPAPAMRRRYAVVSAQENATVWVRRGPARLVAPAGPELGYPPNSFLVDGDIAGSGEWAFIEESDDDVIVDGGAGDDAALGDAGTDADFSGDGGVLFAQLSAVAPLRSTVGVLFTLTATVANMPANWLVFCNGQALATTIVSSTSVQAQVPESLTITQGLTSVWLGDPANTAARSNTLYITIDPAPGAPLVVDYSPDNALPGTTVNIVGSNFSGEPVVIKDANGTVIPAIGAGTVSWVGYSRETLQFVLPAGMPSGPLTVSNSKGAYRGKIFNVGQNLSRIEGVSVDKSSEFNASNWSAASGWDNNLQTSWFSVGGDCASLSTCTKKPFFEIRFASAQTVSRIALRGNREYASGYDFLEGTFEVFGADRVVLWRTTTILPEPDRDIDLTLPAPIAGVTAVRFNSTRDESSEPGFSELQVFGP